MGSALIINALPPKFLQNASPYFFHGAFAPSFIWSRRPCCGDYRHGLGDYRHVLGLDYLLDYELSHLHSYNCVARQDYCHDRWIELLLDDLYRV